MPATASPATASLAGSRDVRGQNRAPQNRPKAIQAQRRLATGSPAADDPGARAAQDRHTRKAPSTITPPPFRERRSPPGRWTLVLLVAAASAIGATVWFTRFGEPMVGGR